MEKHDPAEPVLERPEEHEVGAADELYCWMPGSEDRECTGACVAYDTRYNQDQRLTSCSVLNAIRSIGLSLGIQANSVKAMSRPAPPSPPEVR